jgi:hypothetical protein
MYNRLEYEDQVAVFEWAAIYDQRWPCLELLFGSVMGTLISYKHLNKATRSGMKKGKPDLNLPVPIGGHCGLWIEMKRLKGKKASIEQVQMLKRLAFVGNAAYLCKGSRAAITVITDYLTGKIIRDKDKPPICESWDPTIKLLL